MKRLLLIGLLLPALFLVARAVGLWQKVPPYREINTGHELLCLPMSLDGLFSTPPLFSQLFGNADVTDPSSFLVTFDPEIAAAGIEGYQIAPDSPAFLHATFTYVGEDQLQFELRSGPFSEGLRLEEGEVYVQAVDGKDAWRVSDMPWPDILTWNVYKVRPARNQPLPQSAEGYHLGLCVRYQDGNTSCSIDTGMDGYVVKIDTTEPNIFIKANIKAFLVDQLAEWRQNCRG